MAIHADPVIAKFCALPAVKCLINAAGSNGRCNTPLVAWFHKAFQKEPVSRAVFNYT
jgi:hypothetical protein